MLLHLLHVPFFIFRITAMHLVLVQFNVPPNVQLSGFFQLFVSNVLSVTFLPSTFEATIVPGVKMRRPPPRPPALEVVVVEEEEEEEEAVLNLHHRTFFSM